MKIRRIILSLTLCSFLAQPLSAFADPEDPIMGLMSTNKSNNNNDKTTTNKQDSTQTKKPTTAQLNSSSPDDDDDDFPTDDKPKDNNFGALSNGSDAVTNMLLQSVSLMGIRYKCGGNTRTSGMDYSGFVRYVYQKSLGITLPRTAAEQAKVGKRVVIDDLQPGDLMFFNSRRGSNTHVGMYLGNNKFIQSPRTGDVIKISEFNDSWRKRFNGAKRIVQDNSSKDDSSTTPLQNLQNVHDEPLPVAYRVKNSKPSSHSRTKGKSNKKGSTKSVSTTKKGSTKSSKATSTNKSTTKSTSNSKSKSSSKKKKSTN